MDIIKQRAEVLKPRFAHEDAVEEEQVSEITENDGGQGEGAKNASDTPAGFSLLN